MQFEERKRSQNLQTRTELSKTDILGVPISRILKNLLRSLRVSIEMVLGKSYGRKLVRA
jgi:hypothetical protein